MIILAKKALISVYDKTGIEDFAAGLKKFDYQIVSTGGTAEKLRKTGVDVLDVSEITDYPEMMGGRVKTLHPAIHGALLAVRDNEEHMNEIGDMGIEPIDMVVVNLYPFAETISKEGVTLEEALENIDIGGPTMIRSAAKNFRDVIVVTDPEDYEDVLNEMAENEGDILISTRRELAMKAFRLTSGYDQIITDFLEEKREKFPRELHSVYRKENNLRYGENPHQEAAFYRDEMSREPSIAGASKLHGKDLSFNNINDADAALEIIKEFDPPAAVVIKHTNPCGLAVASDITTAYRKAQAGDPVSAFGSIVALNRKVIAATAEEITGPDRFVEVIIAPEYEEEALRILKERWEDIRILQIPELSQGIPEEMRDQYEFKQVTGGLLLQDRNLPVYSQQKLQVVSRKKPEDRELKELLFAWQAVKHVKSNAIVIARDQSLVGVGAGQMSRVDAMDIAASKAGERSQGAVVASDAFIPFRDVVDRAAAAGIGAIIQPGGSIRDEEVVAAADDLGMIMVFTDFRHFRH
ncbi:MAG: bifunctional phosphoribosylaminoimidazolecarboxamide formyltransferase/IMP cyclohydrolase [Halanaerobiales bacterium]